MAESNEKKPGAPTPAKSPEQDRPEQARRAYHKPAVVSRPLFERMALACDKDFAEDQS